MVIILVMDKPFFFFENFHDMVWYWMVYRMVWYWMVYGMESSKLPLTTAGHKSQSVISVRIYIILYFIWKLWIIFLRGSTQTVVFSRNAFQTERFLNWINFSRDEIRNTLNCIKHLFLTWTNSSLQMYIWIYVFALKNKNLVSINVSICLSFP